MMRVRHRGPSPEVRRNRRIATVAVILVLIAAVIGAFVLFAPRGDVPAPTPTPTPEPSDTPTPTFDATRYSIDNPDSRWVVVNKLRPLSPKDYAPSDLVPINIIGGGQLRARAADQMHELLAAYTKETGKEMRSLSTYRSYARQVDVYNGWVSSLGQAAADKTSARPGHSEHQTGWTMDLGAVPAKCDLDQCFGNTSQGKWLAENAWKYGFIIRYPDGYTDITGYEYEPWHVRYVGKGLAAEMRKQGIATLEEFFGLPAAPDYR